MLILQSAICCSLLAENVKAPISAARVEALSLAVDGGSVSAMVELAGHYLSGSAGRREPALAELLYRRAAALGDADAIFHLGNMYLLGDGIPKDEEQALRLFEKAANQGHPLALQNFESLKTMIDPDSEGVSPSDFNAPISTDEIRAIEVARQHGVQLIFDGIVDPTSQFDGEEQVISPTPEEQSAIPLSENDLGALEDDFLEAEKYFTGQEVAKDDVKAITLYRRAARGGHPLAIERLLGIYEAAGIAPPRCGNINVDDEICF